MAVYPNQFKFFPNHKNQIDDVDAADINAIQDEVNAIQRTLGRNPQRFVNTEASITDYYPSIIGGSGSGGLEDDVTGPLVNYAHIDRTIRADTKEYDNVAQRLDDMQGGKNRHCFKFRATNIDVPKTNAPGYGRPRGIYFPRPNPKHDPFAMHNGIGVTLKKSGFWSFKGHVIYNLQSPNFPTNHGTYNLTVDIDGEYLDGLSKHPHQQNDLIIVLHASEKGFYERGQRITLRTSQTSQITQKVSRATLSGHILREHND